MTEHVQPAQLTREAVLWALQACQGPEQGLSARTLCRALLPDATPADERRLRMIVEELRDEGHPVCALPERGYFWATDPSHIEQTVAWLQGRALTTLRQAARLRRMALPALLGQMALEVDDAA